MLGCVFCICPFFSLSQDMGFQSFNDGVAKSGQLRSVVCSRYYRRREEVHRYGMDRFGINDCCAGRAGGWGVGAHAICLGHAKFLVVLMMMTKMMMMMMMTKKKKKMMMMMMKMMMMMMTTTTTTTRMMMNINDIDGDPPLNHFDHQEHSFWTIVNSKKHCWWWLVLVHDYHSHPPLPGFKNKEVYCVAPIVNPNATKVLGGGKKINMPYKDYSISLRIHINQSGFNGMLQGFWEHSDRRDFCATFSSTVLLYLASPP